MHTYSMLLVVKLGAGSCTLVAQKSFPHTAATAFDMDERSRTRCYIGGIPCDIAQEEVHHLFSGRRVLPERLPEASWVRH